MTMCQNTFTSSFILLVFSVTLFIPICAKVHALDYKKILCKIFFRFFEIIYKNFLKISPKSTEQISKFFYNFFKVSQKLLPFYPKTYSLSFDILQNFSDIKLCVKHLANLPQNIFYTFWKFLPKIIRVFIQNLPYIRVLRKTSLKFVKIFTILWILFPNFREIKFKLR